MSNTSELRAVTDFVAELFGNLVESGEKRVAEFMAAMEQDIVDLWTVPPERQARFLERIELQALGLMELQRIEAVNTTKVGLAQAITAGLRLALRFIGP